MKAKEAKNERKRALSQTNTSLRNVFSLLAFFFPYQFDFYFFYFFPRCAERKKEKETSGFSCDASRETADVVPDFTCASAFALLFACVSCLWRFAGPGKVARNGTAVYRSCAWVGDWVAVQYVRGRCCSVEEWGRSQLH